MDDGVPRQRRVLRDARAAFKDGDFPKALERYDYFFDHALDDDPAALYGVRLSYCLHEWARLGEKYPPALEALKSKKEAARKHLEESRAPDWFRDFNAICRYLNCEDEAIRLFLAYHASDRGLTAEIVTVVWDKLIDGQQWEVCGAYVAKPVELYETQLEKFDQIAAIYSADPRPDWADKEFDELQVRRVARFMGNLILVLRKNGRVIEAEAIEARLAVDANVRSLNGIFPIINKQIEAVQ